jgi:hypothetical protein
LSYANKRRIPLATRTIDSPVISDTLAIGQQERNATMNTTAKPPAKQSDRTRGADRAEAAHSPYLQEIRRILEEALGECEIYFFGSRATGRYTETSDIDVAVLTPRTVGGQRHSVPD